jgi:hypothetical protein
VGQKRSNAYITAFIAPSETYWWDRLNLGTCASFETFERLMQEMLVGLTGVISLVDDIFIWGKSKPEHNANFNAALTVL